MKAREILKASTDAVLINQWELTSISNNENISIVRGWLMDEIERRYPEEFNKWLDSEYPKDEDLRKFINSFYTFVHSTSKIIYYIFIFYIKNITNF